MEREQPGILEQVRAAIADSGLTMYELARRSGVNSASLSRFMHGGELAVATVDRLLPALGVQITITKRKTKSRTR